MIINLIFFHFLPDYHLFNADIDCPGSWFRLGMIAVVGQRGTLHTIVEYDLVSPTSSCLM